MSDNWLKDKQGYVSSVDRAVQDYLYDGGSDETQVFLAKLVDMLLDARVLTEDNIVELLGWSYSFVDKPY